MKIGKHAGYCKGCQLMLAEFDRKVIKVGYLCPRCGQTSTADEARKTEGQRHDI